MPGRQRAYILCENTFSTVGPRILAAITWLAVIDAIVQHTRSRKSSLGDGWLEMIEAGAVIGCDAYSAYNSQSGDSLECANNGAIAWRQSGHSPADLGH